MNIFLWIITGLLAATFLAAGLVKTVQPKEKLAAAGMGWAEDFGPGTIKLVGVLEILAAIGLILPPLLGIAPILVPLAALGLALLMIGAAVIHGRRSEYQMIATNVALLVLAGLVAWGRFGPYSFD